jgi:hypothetical protein
MPSLSDTALTPWAAAYSTASAFCDGVYFFATCFFLRLRARAPSTSRPSSFPSRRSFSTASRLAAALAPRSLARPPDVRPERAQPREVRFACLDGRHGRRIGLRIAWRT